MSLPENLREYLPIDEQAGHSQATAEKVYGFADSASHTRTDMMMRGFKAVSLAWHLLLKIK